MSTITRETTSNRHTNENHYLCGGNNLIVQYALHIIFSTQRVNISTYISHNHYHIHAGINIWYTHILYLFVLVSFFFFLKKYSYILFCMFFRLLTAIVHIHNSIISFGRSSNKHICVCVHKYWVGIVGNTQNEPKSKNNFLLNNRIK